MSWSSQFHHRRMFQNPVEWVGASQLPQHPEHAHGLLWSQLLSIVREVLEVWTMTERTTACARQTRSILTDFGNCSNNAPNQNEWRHRFIRPLFGFDAHAGPAAPGGSLPPEDDWSRQGFTREERLHTPCGPRRALSGRTAWSAPSLRGCGAMGGVNLQAPCWLSGQCAPGPAPPRSPHGFDHTCRCS